MAKPFLILLVMLCLTKTVAAQSIMPNPIRAVVSTEIEEAFAIYDDGGFELGDHDVRTLSPYLASPPTAPVAERLGVAARSGGFGYRVTCGAGQYGEFSVKVDPDKAENVTLSCWARTASGAASVRPLISFESHAQQVDGPLFGDAVLLDSTWTEITFTTSTTSGFLFAYAGIEAPENTTLYIDDLSVDVPLWSLATPDGATSTVGTITVPAAPVAPVKVCFSIHIEDPQNLVNDESYFLRKTAVFTRLAEVFHAHGGYLNIQPELEWALGANVFDRPQTLRDLATSYSVTYSTHTHGPVCYELATGIPYGSAYCAANHAPGDHSRAITDAHVAQYIGIRQAMLSSASGTMVADHNGNFDLVDKDPLALKGIRTLSVFKNKYTQRSYDYLITNPWRPSDADALTDLATFLTHNHNGALVYLPGLGHNITKRHHRVEEKTRRVASQFTRYAEAERVNTMNLILHVDAFSSEQDIPANSYITVVGSGPGATVLYSAEFEQHLQYWDDTLANVIDPLVAGGYLEWATHSEMARAFQEWEMNQQGEYLVKIPSSAGGAEGIGVRVATPAFSRYVEGAPVAIHVEGGTTDGGLTMDGVGLVDQGFVEVYFNFPGSGVVNPSGGTYDYRGPNCLAALRDVTRFALGLTTTNGGRALAQIVSPVTPLSGNVGLVGLSNGGNATLVAAGLHGADMSGLAWIVNYESPVGDGMPTVDAGSKSYAAVGNPEHNLAYNPNNGVWDMSTLKYDANLNVADYLGMGGETFQGGFYFDHNGNGSVDAVQDFVPTPFYVPSSGSITVHYSERIVDYAVANTIFPPPGAKPAHLATPPATADFWLYRNGEHYFSDILTHHPGLMFLVTAHEIDHVQTALDHPHVLTQYEGLRVAGARFVRLNPDRAYVEGVSGQPYPTAADNDGLCPFDHITIRAATQPTGSAPMPVTVQAGCCELADRTKTGDVGGQTGYTSWQTSGDGFWSVY